MPHPYLTPILAAQVSRLTRYYDWVVQLAPQPGDDGSLLRQVDCQVKSVAASVDAIAPPAEAARTAVLLNGNLNHDLDIEATLTAIKPRLNRLKSPLPPQPSLPTSWMLSSEAALSIERRW